MWRCLCAGLLLATSCASGPQAKRDSALTDGDAKVRAERRRQRQAVRDLENELARLKAEMGSMRRGAVTPPPSPVIESAPVAYGEPALRVDVLEPGSESPAVDDGGSGDVVVAGYDDEGVEILYVGEAARAPSFKPDIELSGTGRAAREQRPAPARASLPPVPSTEKSERLEVTAVVGPKAAHASGKSLPAPVVSPPRSRASRAAQDDGRDDAREAYRAAYEALKHRQHAAAIDGFRDFLRLHPKHDYADNAQYWLAEAYYDQRDFDTALAEFGRVIQNYPRGNKATGAQLKIAYCHAALGHGAQAKSLLEKLITEHPNTGPARLAADKLKSL